MAYGFEQNIIAVIWDFDKTLVDGYMQDPIFARYGVDRRKFWQEVNGLCAIYDRKGIRANPETIYLNHFLTCVKQQVFPGLNNAVLRELGAELQYYPGIPAVFQRLRDAVKTEAYQLFNIAVEHYIISTGLAEMIRGSAVADQVKGIWGCEFIEEPVPSKLGQPLSRDASESGPKTIEQVGYAIDNTSKTRAIFEINKGVNVNPDIDVNSRIAPENRRVPWQQMLYIADGPSDVPVFSLLQQNGGRTFAVYPSGDEQAFRQVDNLRADGRVHMYGEADYSADTMTHMWLRDHVRQMAEQIYRRKQEQIRSQVSQPPGHLDHT